MILRPGTICDLVHSQWGDERVARLRQSGWLGAYHPDDVIPWVHPRHLAEMTWLAQTFTAPDRDPVVSR